MARCMMFETRLICAPRGKELVKVAENGTFEQVGRDTACFHALQYVDTVEAEQKALQCILIRGITLLYTTLYTSWTYI